MSDIFTLSAKSRQDVGKGASRRLRKHADEIPAIVYGGDKQPALIALSHNELIKSLKEEAFYSHILTLKIDSKVEKVVLKDLQRHPFKPKVLHADFLRVSAKEAINMHVPIHFTGEDIAPGVKEGGIITHHLTDLAIRCLPGDLPEFINVDVSKLENHQSIHLSDITLPKGVELPAFDAEDESTDSVVVSIHPPKAEVIEEEAPAEEAAEEAAKPEAGEGDDQSGDDKAADE